MISAVITTYGRDFEAIEKAIASVWRQTYSPIEIIVVDDNGKGSVHQRAIENGLQSYPQIVYIVHDVNMGAQRSRNDGIKYAKGELIAFLDDDDEWLESKCEKQAALYTDDVGLIYCKGYTISYQGDEPVQSDYYSSAVFKKEVTFEDMLYRDYIGTTTQAMIPKKVFDICGHFDENLPARQDYEMWMRISQHFRCVGVDEPLFLHYIHQGEQISKDFKSVCIGYEYIHRKYREAYSKNIIARDRILSMRYYFYMMAKSYRKAFITGVKLAIIRPLFLWKNRKKRTAKSALS